MTVMSSTVRRALAGAALSLVTSVLAACGWDPLGPPGSGGLVGHMSGTSDVAGQPGDPAIGGGGLAVIPIAAMEGTFWDLAGEQRVADPRRWAYLALQLSEPQVSQLGGTVAPIDGDGDFRVKVSPGEYAVCRWSEEIGGRVTGCDAVDLPAEGELEASDGEAGFHIWVAD